MRSSNAAESPSNTSPVSQSKSSSDPAESINPSRSRKPNNRRTRSNIREKAEASASTSFLCPGSAIARYDNRKSGAGVSGIDKLNRATVHLGDPLGDRQPESRAACFRRSRAAAGFVHAIEPFKNAL